MSEKLAFETETIGRMVKLSLVHPRFPVRNAVLFHVSVLDGREHAEATLRVWVEHVDFNRLVVLGPEAA